MSELFIGIHKSNSSENSGLQLSYVTARRTWVRVKGSVLINIYLAKKKIAELQHYVDLTESYTAAFERNIIKAYAFKGNLTKGQCKDE